MIVACARIVSTQSILPRDRGRRQTLRFTVNLELLFVGRELAVEADPAVREIHAHRDAV